MNLMWLDYPGADPCVDSRFVVEIIHGPRAFGLAWGTAAQLYCKSNNGRWLYIKRLALHQEHTLHHDGQIAVIIRDSMGSTA